MHELLEVQLRILYNAMITYDGELGGWDELLEREALLLDGLKTIGKEDIGNQVRAELGII